MKKKVAAVSLIICAFIFAGVFKYQVSAEAEAKSVDVMFLHDTHSHLNEFATVENGQSQVVGGFAKIKTLINEQKSKNPDTLLLDGGDFSMGTLIQVVYEEEASELRMLGELGMDATVFGNHEFDYRAKGMGNMLLNAVASGDKLPAIVLSNVDWDAMKAAGFTEEQQFLWDAFEQYGIKEYVVVEKNGVDIAITGVFGTNALACVVNPPLLFKDPIEGVKEAVEDIKAKEDVDMIVCVSHSGIWADDEKSEDENIAKNVPDIDLIISGHTHSMLENPIVHGDTYIVSAAEYGKYLGSLTMTQKDNGRWALDSYDLIPVNETVEADAATQAKVDEFMSMADSKYLEQFGFTREQVLCTNEVEFLTTNIADDAHSELNLGSIIADAYTYAVEKLSDTDPHPVDVAVAPSGTIRDTYALGNITTENVFNSFSLGIGADGIPGYPLISVYLTGAELKTAAEIDASISDFSKTARLYTDGLYWNFNPNRMILNKVTDVYLVDGEENRVELEDDKLYRVVTDYYTSQMLAGVTDLSYGLLSVVPKDAEGNPLVDYEDAIIMTGEQELKAWAAIAHYMTSFEDTDGDSVPNVPAKYGTLEGRKVLEDSKNIVDLLKNPNKFFFAIAAIILVVIALLIGIILLIKKIVTKAVRKHRRNGKK